MKRIDRKSPTMTDKQKHLVWIRDWPKKDGGCQNCGCQFDLGCGHKPLTDMGCHKFRNTCMCCLQASSSPKSEYDEAERLYMEQSGQLRLF